MISCNYTETETKQSETVCISVPNSSLCTKTGTCVWYKTGQFLIYTRAAYFSQITLIFQNVTMKTTIVPKISSCHVSIPEGTDLKNKVPR
jgi:hypothetical protein